MNFREFSSQNPIYIGLMPYLNKHFNNYETFFNSCLIQLIDVHWRDNMHPIFEQIGMTDYGIIKSLNYIRKSICDITVGDPNQTFKNIYFHFGLIFDNIEHMVRNVLSLENELGLCNLKENLLKDKDELKRNYNDWIDEEYEGKIEEYIKTGTPPFPPRSINKIMKILLADDRSLYGEYMRFVFQIRNYRNMFAHNPSVDIFVFPGIGLFCPIKKKVKDYPLWNDMRLKYNDNREDFCDPKDMVFCDFINMLCLLNKVWCIFQSKMDRIFQEESIEDFLTFDRSSA